MKKGLRKQAISLTLEGYSEDLRYVMDGFYGYPNEVEKWTVEYLDSHCNNGHFSRWTAFGNALYVESMEFKKAYENNLC